MIAAKATSKNTKGNVFIHYGDIKGETTTTGFTDWIEVN